MAARPRTRASLSKRLSKFVTGGDVLGISPTRATPPKAAWTVPVEKFSTRGSPPGSRKWTCRSVAAGRITASPTSWRGRPLTAFPIAWIHPSSEIAISIDWSLPDTNARPARTSAGASRRRRGLTGRRRVEEGIGRGTRPAL